MENPANIDHLQLLVLAWLSCQRGKPKKMADLVKPKGGLAAILNSESVEPLIAEALDRLVDAGFVVRIQPKQKGGVATFEITEAGLQGAAGMLGRSELPKVTFAALLKSDLAWIAAGMPASQDARPKGVALTTMLHLALCVKHFGFEIPLGRGVGTAKLELVRLALAKTHGLAPEKIALKKLPTGELPALVAAPLLGLPGSAASKLEKLIETTALRILDISNPKLFSSAVVRQWALAAHNGSAETSLESPGIAVTPEGLKAFSGKVMEAARHIARDGREGSSNLGDKVLIHYCWRRYQQDFAAMPLEQFKQMLAQANGDYLMLACEDLIPETRRAEFMDSEVRVGASPYHYVRLE